MVVNMVEDLCLICGGCCDCRGFEGIRRGCGGCW